MAEVRCDIDVIELEVRQILLVVLVSAATKRDKSSHTLAKQLIDLQN